MAYPGCVFCNAHMFHVVTSVSFPFASAFQKTSGYSHILPCVKWVFYMPTAPNNTGWMEWVSCLVLSCLIFVWMCFLDWGMSVMYEGVSVHVGLLKKGRKKLLCYKLFHNFVWYRSIYFVAFLISVLSMNLLDTGLGFLEILASTYVPGPYGPGPLTIWKWIHAPGPHLKCTLLQEHVCYLCSWSSMFFQIWFWNILQDH